jgi:uncharacterized membrane protein YqjE
VANPIGQNGRTVAEVLNDCKVELKDFVSTRLEMLRGEMKDKLSNLRIALPVLLIGAILLLGAFFLFTLGLVALIAMAMLGQPYAYVVAFFAVFALYALIGGATVAYGVKTLTSQGLAPERTLRVLKEDQIWLQTEARTQL